ncbi:hypothetical protein DS745_09295 [Anaerobacillus alkaliphilus]|uniref:SLH domain-containing protein n=1 Tax=Anaerobacillus alkaliphilus TaxID=1548597 RepID=A0A4Q0VUM6_9BACI|nr:S-layer homology domain-containing protein [Anaerobacillus alkaliphilus]RXJ01665.1 hypothetical protein DS745_09295 [Anaerobacillus alkaliphilus]
MKRFYSLLLAILLVFSTVSPLAVFANETIVEQEVLELQVSRSVFSITEVRTVEVEVDLGEVVDIDNFQWQFGGKSLSEWKKRNSNESFIKEIEPLRYVEGTTIIKGKLEFGLPYNTTNLSNRTIRVLYPALIGNYELAIVNTVEAIKAATTVKLNVYDEFHFYEELKPAIESIFVKAANDEANTRYLEYQNVGHSVEGRDIHFVILARDKGAVDKYLNETLPLALENPAHLLEKLQSGTMGDYQVPIWFNNIHPDEVEGVDAQVELLEKFALQKEVTFNKDNETPVTLNVDETLDHVIYLFMFTSNPDGRVANTRANANGFDLNRDNTYQTQVETIQVNEVIARWTPLSFLDLHGYVNGFLIEPATPPHNPNFEYDLLYHGLIGQAHAIGKAGVANSSLTSYFIPKLSWDSGWDDMTPAYTAIYSMLHGSLGHTIEVPTLSQDSYYAMVGTGLGATKYVLDNKDQLFKNQLEIFKRGVDGNDNRAVDGYFVNAAKDPIGRVRGDNESFFPHYYVLPTAVNQQKNILEVYNTVNYLLRNGVKVEQTNTSVAVNGKTYPAGTYIVPMNQAKRGFANAVLYKGDNVSDWGAMYDPIVVNFPALRGFDQDEVRVASTFAGKTTVVKTVSIPASPVIQGSSKQVLANSNNDTVKLVNELLANGKVVELIVEDKAGLQKGDFVVETKDILPFVTKFVFEAKPLVITEAVKTIKLDQPKVAGVGSAQSRFSLNELGFSLVTVDNADVLVDDAGVLNVAQLSGKTYIGLGVRALNVVKNRAILPGFDFKFTNVSHEGLIKAEVFDHQLTSGYQSEELLYVTTGGWINAIPEGAEVLAKISSDDDFYVAGWWPGHSGAKGQTLAFTKELEDARVTLFANDLAFRGHTQHSYRLLANSIFNAVGTESEVLPEPTPGPVVNTPQVSPVVGGKIVVGSNNLVVEKNGNKTTVTVNGPALVQAAASSEKVSTLVVNIEQKLNEEVVVVFEGNTISDLLKTNPELKLEVQSQIASYILPLAEVNMDALKSQLAVDGNAVKLTIEMEVEKAEPIKSAVSNVVEYKVLASAGETTVELNKFASYVERSIVGDSDFNEKNSIAVRVNTDGTYTPVPTTFSGNVAIFRSKTNSQYVVVENVVSFSDVTKGWAKADIETLASKQIIKGFTNGTFKPNEHVTRIQLAALLVRALGLEASSTSYNGQFKDVQGNEWFAGELMAAHEAGLVLGTHEGNFLPNKVVTREEAATMVTRAINFVNNQKVTAPTSVTSFKDAQQIAPWASESVVRLAELQIVVGYKDGTFKPKATLSRAEAATVIQRLLKELW